MAGFALSYDISEIKGAAQFIQDLGDLDRIELLNDLGSEVENQTRRRIDSEKTDPSGDAWSEWSDEYKKTRHGGQSKLQGEGDLFESIQQAVDSDSVTVGSNLIYAAIHQYGGEDVGIPIPARAYLGFSEENEEDLLAVVETYIEDHLKALQ